MKKILLVFGTRPEAIKMAPVVKELQNNSDQFETIVCVTAQHRQMLDQVLEVFEIRPDYDLDIMKPGQDLYDITANVLLGMRCILEDSCPDLVLVHGDTTTTMAAALAAYYKRITVGHVEAGLRTGIKFAPFPEEINRIVTAHLADIHFAPTVGARQNLLAEGVSEQTIHVTGNTVIDALFMALDKIRNGNLGCEIEKNLITRYPHLQRVLTGSTLNNIQVQQRFILVTGHRRENFGEGFENICLALKDISLSNPEVAIVYPVHLNPKVQEPAKRILSGCPAVHLVEPLDYLPFVYLMDRSYMIITDSGGVQEEAPSLGKPVLVIRETTERPEAVEAGTVKLVGTNRADIVSAASRLLKDTEAYTAMSRAENPYGNGRAAALIRQVLAQFNPKKL